MTSTTDIRHELPGAPVVAARAKQICRALKYDVEYAAFRAAALNCSSDWTCFDGTVVVDNWNLENDKDDLFEEALRAIALKASVFEMTQDELAAEIPIACPVDEMVHAMLAQAQLLERISDRREIHVIHQTDQENNNYHADTYTCAAYTAAWGEPNPRFWLDADVVESRKDHLAGMYQQIGIENFGHSHRIGFAVA